MSYYVKYSPSEDERYLPEAWKKEEYFTISLSRGSLPHVEQKGEGSGINISESDELEAYIREWYNEWGGEMSEFDRVFLENMRKAEAESRVALDTTAIDKAYRVNLVKQEMADAEQREHWARVDASIGRWVPLGEGKYVWENYKEGDKKAPAVVPLKKKAPVKKKAVEVPVVTPLPITRVEVTLGGNDIVIELTSVSDIPSILEGLQGQYGFSEKMKKKLDALLTQNKPT